MPISLYIFHFWGAALPSLQAITAVLHLSFLVAFLIVLIRFIRDFFFFNHPFRDAIERRKSSFFVLLLMYGITMFLIYFLY